MEKNALNLASGSWTMANCGKFPSEKNCRLVMLAPSGQRGDLIDALVNHAVASHGHANTPQLRTSLESTVEVVQL
jgi:hypothetical protein